MSVFLGMRGTGDWDTDERPRSYREGLLRLYPNGRAKLTAIMSKMKSERLTDYQHTWFTKKLPQQEVKLAAPGEIYLDPNLANPYVSGAVDGDLLYVKGPEAQVSEFRAGHRLMLTKESDARYETRAEVLDVRPNGANSSIAVKLLQTPPAVGSNLVDVNYGFLYSNASEQGSTVPTAVSYKPVKFTNFTQITKNAYKITRTAEQTRVRTGDQLTEIDREALELHAVEMEKTAIWSKKREITGPDGEILTETDGIVQQIKDSAPENVFDFKHDAAFSGQTWLVHGMNFFDSVLEQLFREGAGEKLVLCGNGVVSAVNRLARANAEINITPQTQSFGLKVAEWLTPFGTVFLMTHPLFNQKAHTRNMALILEPRHLIYGYIQDTKRLVRRWTASSDNFVDATVGMYLTEWMIMLVFPSLHGILYNVGSDNVV